MENVCECTTKTYQNEYSLKRSICHFRNMETWSKCQLNLAVGHDTESYIVHITNFVR